MSDSNQPPRIRPELLDLPGYDPVLPVDELARRVGMVPADVLKLDANENPFGTSPRVQEAIANAADYSIYPDPVQLRLRDAIADYAGVPPARVLAGAGSDELIDLAVRALVAPGDHIVSCPPTFGMYRFVADVHGAALDEVERRADFSIDVDAVRAAVTDSTALIVVASPNNPTGNLLRDDELQALLDTGANVIVDEAYAEYAESSFIPWTGEHPRLIVLRTFSKWAALAGLRVGFGVFPPSVVDVLLRIKQPYNVNRAAEIAVLAALADRAELVEQARIIVAERDVLFAAIEQMPWLRPYPSDANFILCDVQGVGGFEYKEALAKRGVFIRYFSTPRLEGSVRISVPRPDQTPLLLERMRAAAADLGIARG